MTSPVRPVAPARYLHRGNYSSTPTPGLDYAEETPRSRIYVPANEFPNPAGNDIPFAHRYSTPTAVYRIYADQTLLYVGISKNPLKRWAGGHAVAPFSRDWWRSVTSKTVEWYDDRWMAMVAEHIAIVDENPVHNRDRDRPITRTWSSKKAVRLLNELVPPPSKVVRRSR